MWPLLLPSRTCQPLLGLTRAVRTQDTDVRAWSLGRGVRRSHLRSLPSSTSMYRSASSFTLASAKQTPRVNAKTEPSPERPSRNRTPKALGQAASQACKMRASVGTAAWSDVWGPSQSWREQARAALALSAGGSSPRSGRNFPVPCASPLAHLAARSLAAASGGENRSEEPPPPHRLPVEEAHGGSKGWKTLR